MNKYQLVNQFLNESILFSDKTVSCDLHTWGKNKNTLFIVGLPGSGKSTIGKVMAKKYNAEYFELDQLWKDIVQKYHPEWNPFEGGPNPMDPKTFAKHSIVAIKDKMRKSNKLILEGVQIIGFWNKVPLFKKMISSYPCIILGDSILKSAWRSTRRFFKNKPSSDVPDPDYPTTWQHIKWLRDYRFFNQELGWFKEDRLNVPNTVIKEFNSKRIV